MRHTFTTIITMLLATSMLTAQQLFSYDGYAQGTTFSVKYFDESNRDFSRQVDSLLHDFDHEFSIYDSTSAVSMLNRNANTTVDSSFARCFDMAMNVSKETSGAFDITVAPLVNAWGFGKSSKANVSKTMVDSILQFVGYKNVFLHNGRLVKKDPRLSLNFNAIAQGYSVDIISRFLLDHEVVNFVVEIGGEVYGHGEKPDGSSWIVGVEKPDDNTAKTRNDYKLLISLKDMAVSTSGNYRTFYVENGVKYSHTINPATGYPAKNTLLSATIVASDCATADAYATACMVMGLEKAIIFLGNHGSVGAYLLYSDEEGHVKPYSTGVFPSLILRENE